MSVDVLIVGAGPAGLGAASLLGARDLRVVVVDEYPVAGGRLRGQQYRLPDDRWFIGRERAEDLIQAVAECPGVSLELGTSVLDIRPDAGEWCVTTATNGVARTRRAARCLIATGAVELPLPLKGWTLPGVITAGGAQTLQGTWGVRPGRVGIMVGLTPLAMAVSQELEAAGVHLSGVVMPPALSSTRYLGTPAQQWARLAAWSRSAPVWARWGAGALSDTLVRRLVMPRFPRGGLTVSGVRFRLGVGAVEILGEEHVEAIRLTRLDGDGHPIGKPWEEPVDFVCLAAGLRPLSDVVGAGGALLAHEPRLGGHVPVLDADGRTTQAGLYAAGSAGGVEGAEVAVGQGRLAAAAILADMGHGPDGYPGTFRGAIGEARRRAPLAFQEGVDEGRKAMEHLWSVAMAAEADEEA